MPRQEVVHANLADEMPQQARTIIDAMHAVGLKRLVRAWAMTSARKSPPLREILRDPRLALMLALGFSSGLPFLLIFSTQSAWLREAGVSRSAIGLMSYAALAFTLQVRLGADHRRI